MLHATGLNVSQTADISRGTMGGYDRRMSNECRAVYSSELSMGWVGLGQLYTPVCVEGRRNSACAMGTSYWLANLANTPRRFTLGSCMSYLTRSMRFLSAGCRRVPGGIAHPVRYPYGSRLPKLVGTRTGVNFCIKSRGESRVFCSTGFLKAEFLYTDPTGPDHTKSADFVGDPRGPSRTFSRDPGRRPGSPRKSRTLCGRVRSGPCSGI